MRTLALFIDANGVPGAIKHRVLGHEGEHLATTLSIKLDPAWLERTDYFVVRFSLRGVKTSSALISPTGDTLVYPVPQEVLHSAGECSVQIVGYDLAGPEDDISEALQICKSDIFLLHVLESVAPGPVAGQGPQNALDQAISSAASAWSLVTELRNTIDALRQRVEILEGLSDD